MSKIKTFIINLLLKAKIGEWVAKLFAKLEGKKTEIGIIVLIIIKFCLYAGFIPVEYQGLAQEIEKAIYGAITISFGDKLKRYWQAIKKVGDDIIEEGPFYEPEEG